MTHREDNRLVVRSVRAAVLLSLCLLIVYGGCAVITGGRADVGTFYFAWERRIPLVPAMVVPYVSWDVLFVACIFLCRDRRELRMLTGRTLLAIALAGAGFLIWPLRFGFERPACGGALGAMLRMVWTVDRPYNMFPSLHVAIAVILWVAFARRVRWPINVAVHIWLVLVVFSTLLTYQHHVIDVIGGAGVGVVSCVVLRGGAREQGYRPVSLRLATSRLSSVVMM
jgi:membrane-associated phospholipid phosphatase